MRRPAFLVFVSLLLASSLIGCGENASSSSRKCNENTFAQIQTIFDSRGCTSSTCHGQASETAAGGLDLRAESAYENLINVAGQSADLVHVFPGDEELSLLYLKLAAKTEDLDLGELGVSGGPMPSTGDALSTDELALLKAWIRGGAPESGVVAGAADAVGCDASEVDISPNKIPPLPPPSRDEGVQLYSGAWSLGAESENEVCFVTYYDFSSEVPDEKKVPCPESHGGAERECFAYSSILIAQDPQSHHALVETYIPPPEKPEQWDPTDASWQEWVCVGGEGDGQACDPLDLGGCGERSACATRPETSVACVGYPHGPPEMAGIAGFFGDSSSRKNVAFAQEPSLREEYPSGVYGVLPIKGYTIWNSHSFNLTTQATSIEQYMNFEFTDPSNQAYLRQDLIVFDAIFAMGTIPPFESTEVCASYTVERGARLITLTSHTHQRGRDFRIWYPPNGSCEAGPECTPPTDREPDYRSFVYDDPLTQRFGEDDVLAFDATGEDERTFLYCAIFDNGEEDPTTVRRHSQRPDTRTCEFTEQAGGLVTQCGCEPEARACFGGPEEGMSCGGDDAICGGGGVCDACPLGGGITTEEEMFALGGAYYVVPQ